MPPPTLIAPLPIVVPLAAPVVDAPERPLAAVGTALVATEPREVANPDGAAPVAVVAPAAPGVTLEAAPVAALVAPATDDAPAVVPLAANATAFA